MLQWGEFCNSSGQCIGNWLNWTYASWVVSSSGAAYWSTPLTVNVGDVLDGTITIYGFGQPWWDVQAVDITSGLSSTLVTAWNQTGPLNQASMGVVEAHNGNGVSCSDFPNGTNGYTVFGNAQVYVPVNGNLYSTHLVDPSWDLCWTGMSSPPSLCRSSYTGQACGFGATVLAGGAGTSLTY